VIPVPKNGKNTVYTKPGKLPNTRNVREISAGFSVILTGTIKIGSIEPLALLPSVGY